MRSVRAGGGPARPRAPRDMCPGERGRRVTQRQAAVAAAGERGCDGGGGVRPRLLRRRRLQQRAARLPGAPGNLTMQWVVRLALSKSATLALQGARGHRAGKQAWTWGGGAAQAGGLQDHQLAMQACATGQGGWGRQPEPSVAVVGSCHVRRRGAGGGGGRRAARLKNRSSLYRQADTGMKNSLFFMRATLQGGRGEGRVGARGACLRRGARAGAAPCRLLPCRLQLPGQPRHGRGSQHQQPAWHAQVWGLRRRVRELHG